MIIYTVDQGFFLSELGLYDNRIIYEKETLRVPLRVRWPDVVEAGTVNFEFALNLRLPGDDPKNIGNHPRTGYAALNKFEENRLQRVEFARKKAAQYFSLSFMGIHVLSFLLRLKH